MMGELTSRVYVFGVNPVFGWLAPNRPNVSEIGQSLRDRAPLHVIRHLSIASMRPPYASGYAPEHGCAYKQMRSSSGPSIAANERLFAGPTSTYSLIDFLRR